MPRVARAVLLALLASFVVAPLCTAGAPELGGPITLAGTATAALIPGHGVAVAGGAFDETMVCDACVIDLTLQSGTFVLVQQGQQVVLPPGTYEIRDFFGVYGYSGSFAELHGEGKVFETVAL